MENYKGLNPSKGIILNVRGEYYKSQGKPIEIYKIQESGAEQ